MLSSQGKSTGNEAIGKQVASATESEFEQGLDVEQIFRLIESIFSFEASLYHQILPLRLEDNNLLLGMVNLQDNGALDYVSRILSYINCTIETQQITAENHHAILSAYLNYKNTREGGDEGDEGVGGVGGDEGVGGVGGDEGDEGVGEVNSSPASPASPASPTSSAIPVLHLTVPEFSSIEELITLPPRRLLEELLGRVLAGGIGRLYLERRPYQGRILWSENGILQSVIETLPLSVFQGVLNEFKRFASLPVTTITEAKQIEKEYLYQQDRLLLRVRVMPGMHGEQATLQVLRGAALKFYQQQQLARLSRDALGISQQLSYKLQELQKRLLLNQEVNSGKLEAFNTLNELLKNLDYHIRALTDTR